MKLGFLVIVVLTLTVLYLIFAPKSSGSKNVCLTPECLSAVHKFHEFLNASVEPCDDFYEFVCGNFVNNYSVREKVSTPWDAIMRKSKIEQMAIRNEPIGSNDSNSLILVKHFYGSCLNATLHVNYDKTIIKYFEELGGWPLLVGSSWSPENFSWDNITWKARELGLEFPWFIKFDPNIVCLTPNAPQSCLFITYPIVKQGQDTEDRGYYQPLISEAADHFGVSKEGSAKDISDLLNFEEQLTRIINEAKEIQIPKDYSVSLPELLLWPGIHWADFLVRIVKRNLTDTFLFQTDLSPEYLSAFNKLISNTSMRTQANYFIWKVYLQLAPFSGIQLKTSHHVEIRTNKKQIEFCKRFADIMLPHVVESEYVRRHPTNKSSKRKILEILNGIKEQYIKAISKNSWMDLETTEDAQNYMRNIEYILGGPDIMFNKKDYDRALKLENFEFKSDNFIHMLTQLQEHQNNVGFSKIFDIWDMFEYVSRSMNYSDFNAGFSYYLNSLILSTPSLDNEVVSQNRPDYLNYGALGTLVGHEFGHALDPTIRISPYKNKSSWFWVTSSYMEKYENLLLCVVERFSNFTRYLNLNKDWVYEIFADTISVDVVYEAYRNAVDGDEAQLPELNFAPNQMFWIQMGYVFCYNENEAPNSDVDIHSENHPHPKHRLLSNLQNSKYFAEDFHCALNSALNPEIKCSIS